ncbi:Dps family protein [Flavobacterium sp.]|jgi:starvation-inducible DNA-binding protein|uniref:Dps family protein n=1 Tax=Flavobacterium sp. TaxID=239 RepID=UPI0037C07811
MKAHIGITEKNGQSVVDELSKILADEFVLYTKTRKAHWNLEGPDFFEKHTFFELQYRQLEEFIDEVAERIRKLGFYTPASLTDFLSLTQLTEVTSEKNDSKGFIKELLIDHESVIINLRENISKFDKEFHDAGSTDFITGLMKEHEKMAWILRSHL